MPRIRHVGGVAVYRHTTIGRSTPGDEHTVPGAAAMYLCDEVGYFERVGGYSADADGDGDGDAGDAGAEDMDIPDPAEHTVVELRELIDGADGQVLDAYERAERNGEQRTTALEAIASERDS
jgi:hypothetical protein